MAKVTAYKILKRKDGTEFLALELSGKLEIVQSQETGNFYATVRKCYIPSTFNEDLAKSMIGQEVDGEVVRVQVDTYEYINPRTGELMSLDHSYAYRPSGSLELIGHTKMTDLITV